ncbi:MAG: DoxX family protein [Fidelibacterota bacterium]
MKKLIWIPQGLLIVMFAMVGFMKLTQPIEALSAQMSWVTHFQPWIVRTIAFLEILGAVGLLLPAFIKSLPSKLMFFAAAGLALTMVGAVITHVAIGETSQSIIPFVLFAMSAYVTFYRNRELGEA